MEIVKPLLLIVPICVGSAAVAVPEIVTLAVGQPFYYLFESDSRSVDVQDASGEGLPAWLIWKKNDRILEGVPRLTDTGKTFLRIMEGNNTDVMEISIHEEIKNPCGAERNTFWMELAFDTSLTSLSITDQLHLANIVSDFLNISRSVLRIYPNKYKEAIRRSELVKSGMQHAPNDDSATIMWKLSCDEFDEDAINILERILTFDESDAISNLGRKLVGWELKKGTLLSRGERIHIGRTNIISQLSGFATNEPHISLERATSNTTPRFMRSTKKIDKPPLRLNSLQAFTCKRGMLCEYIIPRETFMDIEDGDTRSLSLSVYPIIADRNWLILDKKEQILRGISLLVGDFEFRVEARDSSNQMTSAPFQVTVVDAPPTNHLFILEVAHNSERLLKDPSTLYAFAEKLANSLGDRYPKHLVIRNIEAVDGIRPQSRIIFSNGTLSYKFCQRKAIDGMKHVMVTKRRDRIRADFARNMGNRFHVRTAKLELRGSCVQELSTSNFPISVFTTSFPPEYEVSSTYLWFSMAVIVFITFFLSTVALIYCLVKRKKTKTVQSEYVSKGLPIVFPEEIPQEDDSATVSTPMLVKEERPPLVISQHENPLYKPPPPLSTASSPRPRNAFTSQRQPPPYVPP